MNINNLQRSSLLPRGETIYMAMVKLSSSMPLPVFAECSTLDDALVAVKTQFPDGEILSLTAYRGAIAKTPTQVAAKPEAVMGGEVHTTSTQAWIGPGHTMPTHATRNSNEFSEQELEYMNYMPDFFPYKARRPIFKGLHVDTGTGMTMIPFNLLTKHIDVFSIGSQYYFQLAKEIGNDHPVQITERHSIAFKSHQDAFSKAIRTLLGILESSKFSGAIITYQWEPKKEA